MDDHFDHFTDCNKDGSGSISHSHNSRRPIWACNAAFRPITSSRQQWLAYGPSQAEEECDFEFPRTDSTCNILTYFHVDFLGYWYLSVQIEILSVLCCFLAFFVWLNGIDELGWLVFCGQGMLRLGKMWHHLILPRLGVRCAMEKKVGSMRVWRKGFQLFIANCTHLKASWITPLASFIMWGLMVWKPFDYYITFWLCFVYTIELPILFWKY